MCDFFWQAAENDQGDLTDIIRSGGHAGMASSSELSASEWPVPATHDQAAAFPPSSSSDDFGNPFPNFQDPLLNEFLDVPQSEGGGGLHGGGGANGVLGQDMMKSCNKPCNIMPRVGHVVHQMPSGAGMKPSPLSPRAIRPYPMIPGGCVGPPSIDVHQISSPRGGPGMKRRKNQAKKVICIPAPAASTGGRSTGEVIPSDLWAWRKYGQKPIKGSPYPRGYYRCSSSKGCSARKQVERSRTDPNMLVITYTSEHNHPWPTQRNALAGSTRSQLTKSNSSSSSNKGFQNNQKQQQQQQQQRQQEGQNETPKEEPSSENNTTTACKNNVDPCIVKEEEMSVVGKPLDAAQDDEFGPELLIDQYKPMIPDSGQPDDFFADLQELEADPMSLIFSKEYMEAKPDQEEKGGDNSKGSIDPFNMFDWVNLGGSSCGEAKKG